MKLTIVVLIIGCLQVSAKGYGQKITLSKQNSSFSSLFEHIKKQTGYSFFYNNKSFKAAGKISIDLKDAGMEEALTVILKGQPFTYIIIDKTVVIKKQPPVVSHPTEVLVNLINVHGLITDAEGKPLPGASVQIKGTKEGTTSSVAGQFSIHAKAGDILVIKYVGFVTKEFTVTSSEAALTIVMEAVKQNLEEIVVTALGIKRAEKSLGYAVQKISGEKLQTVKGVDIGTSLTGQISGLVVKNSTEFNARPTLELRGENALLVIDGVPYGNMTLRDVPTDDIESMDLLKGSTASALYGSRAEGGVLLITTKKGAAGKGLAIDVNSNTMFQLGFLAIPKVQSSYGRGQNGKIDNDYVWGPKLDAGNTARDWNPVTKQFEDGRPLVSVGKDNLKNFMNTGLVTNNNIAIAQTGENGKSRFGVSRRSAPQIWGAGYGTQGYLYQLTMWTGTEYDIRDYKDYWKVPNKTQNWMYTNWYDNPYLIAYEKLDGITQNTVNANVTANYKFSKDFNLMLRLGYDNYNNKETMTNPTANIFSTRGKDIGGWDAKGLYRLYKTWGFSTNNDLILTLNAATKGGLISPRFFSLKGSVEPATINQGGSSRQINSLYGRASVGWNDAVFFDFTGRNDWNSAQPK
eukprot:gene18199-21719_t